MFNLKELRGFEYSILKKPVFLYAPDIQSYDRGLYFPMTSLPFSLSSNEEELIINLVSYNDPKYVLKAQVFLKQKFDIVGNGNACKEFVTWMKNNLAS